VPVVLNMNSDIETAVKPLPRFGMGARLRALVPSATPASTCAVAFARRGTGTAANAFKLRSVLAATGYATDSQLTGEQFAHMTLIPASSGGALGPHPAREPV
jgi:hypothetical protein